jgi:hypothetical protein
MMIAVVFGVCMVLDWLFDEVDSAESLANVAPELPTADSSVDQGVVDNNAPVTETVPVTNL